MSVPEVESFFEPFTETWSHLLIAPEGCCAILDPVLDYDYRSGRTGTASAGRIAARVRERGLTVEWILETHVHADHLSAGDHLRRTLSGRLAIGEHVCEVQQRFARLYGAGADFRSDGSQFDRLFTDGERFRLGSLEIEVLHGPGHTPACVAYRVGTAVFVGDLIFMPDVGTARCDFPGGSARALYRSVRRILDLPPDTVLYFCHDYPPEGRERSAYASVAAQRAANIDIHDGIGEDEFVARRLARDAGMPLPRLMLPALQVNMRAGALPPAEADGVQYLKIPLNVLGAPDAADDPQP